MSNTNLKENLLSINELVYPVIKELLTQDVEENNSEIAIYQCEAGGKRIRPALVVLSGQMFGADINNLLYPAASIEIIHNATLIIDDIIDHSEFRRDQPTCWNKFGKSIAELASSYYLASAFSGLSCVNNSSRLINLYSKATKVIIDGEVKDILFERFGREDEAFIAKNRYQTITKNDYFEMISQKTATMLKICCQAGAICADASDEQIEIVGDFGLNLGMAFQIRDDLLDIFGDEKEFGKKIGKDIIEKKMGNFIILSAIDKLEYEDKNILFSLLEGSEEISDDDIAMVTSLIEKTDARIVAENTANKFIQNAMDSLNKLPQNEHAEKLKEIANYIVNRKV